MKAEKQSQEAAPLTVSKFASLMSCDRHSLTQKMNEQGAEEVGTKFGGKLYNLRDLVLAFAGGDERAERIRKTRAEAEKLERFNARTRGELVEVEKVKALGMKFCSAIKQRILNSPLPAEEQDLILSDLAELSSQDWE